MIARAGRLIGEALALYRARKHHKSFVAIRYRGRLECLGLPTALWGTKSHDFWVLLGVLLRKIQPRSLLELGSGRSTIYLSEYAGKQGAELVSVDQDPAWVAVNRLICRFGGLGEDFLHHVALQDDGFYSVAQLNRIVKVPDFVFIDGPVRRGSTQAQMDWLRGVVRSAQMIVIDDVHRRHLFRQIEPLAEASGCRNRWFHRYRVNSKFENCLCILCNDQVQPVIDDAIRYIGVPIADSYVEDDCPED